MSGSLNAGLVSLLPMSAECSLNNPCYIRCITAATWNATLTLDAVNHGKLMIKVDFPTPHVVSEKGVAWRDQLGSRYDTVIADLNKKVENGVNKLDTIARDLKTDIEGLFGGENSLWTFIFGGNDDFFIDKVGFNR